jgi:hypothetical protein
MNTIIRRVNTISSLSGRKIILLFLCIFLIISALLGCSTITSSDSNSALPQDGLWVGNIPGGGTISLSIKDTQIQYLDYSEFMMMGNAQGTAHCSFGSVTPIQTNGNFSNKGTTGQFSGGFDTPTKGHISFEFTYCSGTTTQGQSTTFQGSLSGETDIELLP